MRSHPYLRAYMAGVLVPTWMLLVGLALYLTAQATGHFPGGLDRAFIFPMAVVPNLWGMWNLVYTSAGLRRRIGLGLFGAILPPFLATAGMALQSALEVHFFGWRDTLLFLPVAMALYFLVWKYVVGFLNRVVDLA